MKPLVKDVAKLFADVWTVLHGNLDINLEDRGSIRQDIRKEKQIDFKRLLSQLICDVVGHFGCLHPLNLVGKYQDQELDADGLLAYEELKKALFTVRLCQDDEGECSDDVDVYFATSGDELVLCEKHAREIDVVVFFDGKPMTRQYYDDVYIPYLKASDESSKKILFATRMCQQGMGECGDNAISFHLKNGKRIVLCVRHFHEVNKVVFGKEDLLPDQCMSAEYEAYIETLLHLKE